MSKSKDSLFVQAVFAFAQGCGTVDLGDDAAEEFRKRYYHWIDKPKANGKTPQEVWDQQGKGFLEKFKAIGQKAGAGGKQIDAKTLTDSALAIETDSDCPYCPVKP